jgi:small subunit ribosomal protein S4
MGDPKKTRKQYKRPLKIWDKESIANEKNLIQSYGLRNKREIWKAETLLRKKRKTARSLLALELEERVMREKDLLGSLARIGILDEKATLDDVLTLSIESFLERRLQTLVWRKGLANTASQARQFIVHGHIAIGGRRVTAPSQIVTAEEEKKLGYYGGKKMVLRPAVKEAKPAKPAEKEKGLKEEFEEAKPAQSEEKMSPEDVMKLVRQSKGKEPEGEKAGEEGQAEEKAEKREGKAMEKAEEGKKAVGKQEKDGAGEEKPKEEGKKEKEAK